MGTPVAAQWRQVVDVESRAVSWVDDGLYLAWSERAVALSSVEVSRRLVGLSSEDVSRVQRAAVRELVEAVAWVYRACDTPPLSDPVFVREYLGAVNGGFGEERVPGDPTGSGSWVDELGASFYVPGYAIDVLRARLDDDANVTPGGLALDPGAWAPDGDTRFVTVPGAPRPNGRERIPAGVEAWWSAKVNNRCARRSNVFADCDAWDATVLPAAEREFALWSRIASSLYQRGARRVQSEAREYALLRNLRVLRVWRGGGTNTLALIGEAERVEAEGERVNANLGSTLFQFASAAAALNPVAGLVLAIPAAIASFAPPAFATQRDAFGRGWPSFQRWRISGGASATEPPSVPMEAPGGFRRAEVGTLRVVMPETLPGAAVRVDGGEWRPLLWSGEVTAGVHLVEARATDRVPWGVTLRVGAGESVVRLVDESSLPPVGSNADTTGGTGGASTGGGSGQGGGMANSTVAELFVDVSVGLRAEAVEVKVTPERAGLAGSDWTRPPLTLRWEGAATVTVSARAPTRPERSQTVVIAQGAKVSVTVDAASLPVEGGEAGGAGGGEVSYSLRRVWVNHKGKFALAGLLGVGALGWTQRARLRSLVE